MATGGPDRTEYRHLSDDEKDRRMSNAISLVKRGAKVENALEQAGVPRRTYYKCA